MKAWPRFGVYASEGELYEERHHLLVLQPDETDDDDTPRSMMQKSTFTHPKETRLGLSSASGSKFQNPPTGLKCYILWLQHIKELCSFMVIVSAEIAKKCGEKSHVIQNRKEMEQLGTPLGASSQETKRVHNQDEVSNVSKYKSNKISTSAFASVGFDLQNGRSESRETLPLLSNERSTTDQHLAVRSSDSY